MSHLAGRLLKIVPDQDPFYCKPYNFINFEVSRLQWRVVLGNASKIRFHFSNYVLLCSTEVSNYDQLAGINN